jgi:hypothetical protein
LACDGRATLVYKYANTQVRMGKFAQIRLTCLFKSMNMQMPTEISELASEQPTFVYIVGRGHSGSTMLELMLNRSRHIAAMGEIDMLALQIYRDHKTRWVGQCSCEERPNVCPHWRAVIDDIKKVHGFDLMNNPFRWRISDVGVEEEYGVRAPLAWLWYKFHRLVRSYAYQNEVPRATPWDSTYQGWIENRDFVATSYAKNRDVQAVVDASKDPLQMRDIAKYSKLPVKILFLTRDVRGLVWSAVKKKRLPALEEARSWTKLNKRTFNLLQGIDPSLWMQVKYEDLCADPEASLDQIHEFIGIPRASLAPLEEKARRHTIAGNRTRFRVLDEIREDLGWMENLDEADLRMIDREAGEMSTKLGY